MLFAIERRTGPDAAENRHVPEHVLLAFVLEFVVNVLVTSPVVIWWCRLALPALAVWALRDEIAGAADDAAADKSAPAKSAPQPAALEAGDAPPSELAAPVAPAAAAAAASARPEGEAKEAPGDASRCRRRRRRQSSASVTLLGVKLLCGQGPTSPTDADAQSPDEWFDAPNPLCGPPGQDRAAAPGARGDVAILQFCAGEQEQEHVDFSHLDDLQC